ncbi:MAG: hypothetical protein ACXAAH_12795 [Promethearchaeota archaeon]|jgi:hypothetical protein
MPKQSNLSKQSKVKKIKDPTPDTAFAKKSCGMPLTKNYIDVEAGIKKDKEVKEKDVFDFLPKRTTKPKTASKKKS